MSGERPSESVLRAFEAGSRPLQLPGGQGTSWKAGGLVFKPSDGPVHQWPVRGWKDCSWTECAWPCRSQLNGGWTVDGLGATWCVPGSGPDLSLRRHGWASLPRAVRFTERSLAFDMRPSSTRATTPGRSQIAWLGGEANALVSELADIAARLFARPGPPGDLSSCTAISRATSSSLMGSHLPSSTSRPTGGLRPTRKVWSSQICSATTVLTGLLSRCWVCLRRRLRERCSSEWRPPTSLLRLGPSLSTCLMKRSDTARCTRLGV